MADMKFEKSSTNKRELERNSTISDEELAKNSVETDITVDGETVQKTVLPEDLVRLINKEQKKAISETEEEIKNSGHQTLTDKERIMESVDPTLVANTRVRHGSYSSTSANVQGESGTTATVKDSNAKFSGSYNVDDSEPTPQSTRSEHSGTQTSTNTSSIQNENSQTVNQEGEMQNPSGTPNFNNREQLRQNLENLSNNQNRGSSANFANSGTNNPQNGGELNNNSGVNGSNSMDDGTVGSGTSTNARAGATAGAAAFGAGTAAGAAAGARTRSRGGGGTAGTPDSSDIDERLTEDMRRGAHRAERAARGAARKTVAATKSVKTALKAKKLMTVGAILGFGGIFILIFLVVVGALSFIMNMPGMVRDKIVDTFDSLWQQAKGLIVGQDQPSDAQVTQLAKYLQDMGYDLRYNGFATDIEEEADGTIKDIESKYLAAYIAAEQRSYMIANENMSVKSIWKGVTSLFEEGKETDWNEPWGTGMIVLETNLLEGILDGTKNLEKIVSNIFGEGAGDAVARLNPINYLKSITNSIYDWCTGKRSDVGNKVADLSPISARVIIKRDTKEMYLSKVDIRDIFNTGGYDVYRYSLKEWTERYGTPTELFLSLHLATRAPEFAFKFATSYDTKVFLEIKELENVKLEVVYAETEKDGTVRLDDTGKPIMISLTGMTDAQIKEEIKKSNPKLQGVTDETLAELRKVPDKITAFTPYITKVMNHWYYDQIIYEGKYNNKDIRVYKIKSLEPGQPGYERYYAYTRRDNSDSQQIKHDTEKVDPESSWLGQLINFAIKVFKAYMTGGMSLVKETVYEEVKTVVVEQAIEQVKGMLPDELVAGFEGMYSLYQDGGLNWDNISQKLGINNMAEILDMNKLVEFMSIENLQLQAEDLLTELNLGEQLMNMDLGGIGSINDLDKMLTEFPNNLQNLETAFSDGLTNIVDFSNTNLDKFANIMSEGISLDSITGIQDSFLNLFDEKMFVGLTELEYDQFSNTLIDGVSKQISDITATPMMQKLTGALEGAISGELANGMFNTEVLAGLQNEFSKQVTGMSFDKLKNMAQVPDLDFNKIVELSDQVTGLTKTLDGAVNSIDNLGNKANDLAKQITGLDTQILNSVTNGFEKIGKEVTDVYDTIDQTREVLMDDATKATVKSLKSSINTLERQIKDYDGIKDHLKLKELGELKDELAKKKNQLSDTLGSVYDKVEDANVKNVLNKIDTLENQVRDLENAKDYLDIDAIEKLEKEIAGTQNQLTKTLTNLDNIDDKILKNITSEASKIEHTATSMINRIQNLDKVSARTIVHKLEGIDQSGLVDLATDLYNLDVTNNDMMKYVNNYITDVSGLKTQDVNLLMDAINGKNISAQKAIDRVSKYLLRDGAEAEIRGYLRDLNGTVKLIEDYTVNLDKDKIVDLVDKVADFDSSALNVFSKQINKLQNASIDKLMKQVEDLPKKVVGQVTDKLKEKITEGIKDKIVSNVSSNIKSKLLGSNNFANVFKSRLTAGEQFDGMDPDIEDEEVSEPDAEYATGFYIKETREVDYFQVAEPVRVLYPASHWKKMFMEDKYVILDSGGIDLKRIDEEVYVLQNGKTIWEATEGNVKEAILAMLQGIQSADSQYLFRYFKELFNDFDWIFDRNVGGSKKDTEIDEVSQDYIGWLFKTVEEQEITYVGDRVLIETLEFKVTEEQVKLRDPLIAIAKGNMPPNADYYEYQVYDKWFTSDDKLEIKYYQYINPETRPVKKAEYAPYVWTSTQMAIINSKKQDPVYGFKEGMDIISPVNGVVVAKTSGAKNELGEKISDSITIELRNTGDETLDGMKIILIGGDYSGMNVGSLLRKITYTLDEQGNYIGDTSVSVIGKTTDEPIKVMMLNKDQTPVEDVSKYIYPPYEQYESLESEGDEVNANKPENGNTNTTPKQ